MNRREARELVREHGGTMLDRVDQTVDVIVIGADQLPLDDADELLDEWTLAAASNGLIEIINEAELWSELGLLDHDWEMQRLYTPAMLAGLLKLPISTIRRWHRRGLIYPARQVNKLAYFDFQEVASARRIARLIAAGASPQAVESKLSRLARLYPDLQRPLSQLSIIVEGRDLLLRQGEGLIEASGQMRLNFDAERSDPTTDADRNSDDSSIGIPGDGLYHSEENPHHETIIPLNRAIAERDVDRFTTPAEFIEMATELEDEFEIDAAIETYRAMSLAFGPSADVCFRLAELLYQQLDLVAARERYYIAIELDDTFVEARASLGCVLVEMGQHELALSAFEGALLHHADYPDVHFHLARLLDEMDRPLAAESHWKRFLELAPRSAWADEARERLTLPS